VRLVIGARGDPGLRSSFCAADSFLSVFAGGNDLVGIVEQMRLNERALLRLPGMNTSALMASSRWSSRSFALRDALSGPWQAKQFSERIGRMSRLYSSCCALGGAAKGAQENDGHDG